MTWIGSYLVELMVALTVVVLGGCYNLIVLWDRHKRTNNDLTQLIASVAAVVETESKLQTRVALLEQADLSTQRVLAAVEPALRELSAIGAKLDALLQSTERRLETLENCIYNIKTHDTHGH